METTPQTDTHHPKNLESFLQIVSKLVECKPIVSNPKGQYACCSEIKNLLVSLGFTVDTYPKVQNPPKFNTPSEQPILTAFRKSKQKNAKTLGIFGHYDVEEIHNKAKWKTPDPFKVTVLEDGRIYARGIGDNLGPIAQRLQILQELILSKNPLPNIYITLQGEEEIGSPLALKQYEKTQTPHIDLWLEETSYFEKDGTFRFLVQNSSEWLEKLIQQLAKHVKKNKIINRPLNKAFGVENCPCLKHLLKKTPYLALGPNDVATNIHSSNESILVSNLETSRIMFTHLLQLLI